MNKTTKHNITVTSSAAEKSQPRVPKLRFKEFEGEWEERKLKDFTKINQGLQIAIAERFMEEAEGLHFYITNEFLRAGSTKKYFIKNPTESVLCNEDDILMTRTGNTGQVVTGVKGAFHNNFFKIKFDSDCDKWFLYYFLTDYKTQHTIMKLAGTSTIPDLNHGDFYRLKINLPNLPEQQKIANFLTEVDTKLQQLTTKKEALEKYKKGVMQQLFSQQLRFKADDGSDFADWEEKRLGEVATFLKGRNISKADIVENGTLECIRYGELYTEYAELISNIKSKTNLRAEDLVLSESNDVIIPASGETQIDIATASCVLKSGVALGGDLNIIRTKIDGVFLSYYLNNKKKFDIARLSQGISVVHLYSSQLKTLKLELPSLKEQQKIATYLSAIDLKIEAVQTQLTKTQAFKKGLLQSMFV
ncbi:restriction endonuclease subunit S [Psychroserpens sp. AS72]|uniref:restriction endonuclease subunit S n=1 Tax=Psychroserpens sp. AS72 TaxID=3135775 RepID=UPI00316EE8FD